jgi:hypothetical protein
MTVRGRLRVIIRILLRNVGSAVGTASPPFIKLLFMFTELACLRRHPIRHLRL